MAPNRFKDLWREWICSKFLRCNPLLPRCTIKVDGHSAELQLSESLENFSVAVVATDDGRFAYQVFLVCGEPRTLLTDSARYLTPDDAAQAGYQAVASMSETPVRRPYAPSSPRRHVPWLLPSV
jgi:hypothetical protein